MKNDKKKEEKRIARNVSSAYATEIRQKNTLAFLDKFGEHNRLWIQQLADAFRARGKFGLHLFSLADHYDDLRDKEVAMFVSLLFANNDQLLIQQGTMLDVLGSHPYDTMIAKGGLSDLTIGEVQNERLPGTFTRNFHIAHLLSRVRELYDEYGGIENSIREVLKENKCFDPFMALSNLLMGIDNNQRQFKFNLLLMIMAETEGLGIGAGNFPEKPLYCPENKAVIEFLEIWFPEYHRCGLPFDKALNYFGLRRQTDFYYAYLGFDVLKKVNTDEVKKYVRMYQHRFDIRKVDRLYDLRNAVPRIFFEPELE